VSDAPFDAAALFRRLYEAQVRYVVIGGFAVIAHGGQRLTNDLDICPASDRENLVRLATLLRQLDAVQLGVSDDFPAEEFPYDATDVDDLAEGGNFRLATSLGVLDVLQWIPGIGEDAAYSTLASQAIEGHVHGVPVAVCSLEHLRQMKRAADRPRDRQDLADLDEVHGRG